MPNSIFRSWLRLDWLLMLSAVALCCFGVVAIYSLSLSREPDTFWTLKKQLIAISMGFFVCLVVARSNYKALRNFSFLLYLSSLVMLVAVLFLGRHIRGTVGWFALGPLNFQPVEFAKIALIVVLARYFAAHTREPLGWRTLIESGILVALPAGLTMLQPDLGSALVLCGIWGLMMLTVGMRRRVVMISALTAVVIAVAGWSFMAPYQRERIETFLNPARDPLGQGYNVIQARIAIGSGGFGGRGIGFGSQSQLRFLPESQTDFIASVLGEELGFVGLFAMLFVFALLFTRLLVVALRAPDDFGALLVFGVLFLILIQFTVNLGMNVALLPVTGITLPFVSYGASAMLILLLALGVAQSVAAQGVLVRE